MQTPHPNQKHNQKPHQALAALAVGLASVTLLTAGFAARNPFPVVSGGLAGALAVGLTRRHSLKGQDFQLALDEVTASMDAAAEVLQSTSKQTAIATLRYLPEPIKPWVERQIEQHQDTSWAIAMRRRSKMVVGASGSGKTSWELFEVHGFITDHPNGRIQIGDLNYGKPGFGGRPNTWLNLPKDRFIRDDAMSVYEGICDYWAEMQKRKAESKKLATAIQKGEAPADSTIGWEPWFLLIDEGIVTLDAIAAVDEDWAEDALQKCGDLLFEGRGYNVQLTFVVQSIYKEDHDFGRGKLQQMNFLILGSSANDPETLRMIPGIGTQSAQWANKVEETRKLKGCAHACLVKCAQDSPMFAVRVIPEIDPTELRVVLPDAEDTQTWLEKTLTPDLVAQLQILSSKQATGEIKGGFKEACLLMGLGRNAASRYPEEHGQLKKFWADLLEKPDSQDLV